MPLYHRQGEHANAATPTNIGKLEEAVWIKIDCVHQESRSPTWRRTSLRSVRTDGVVLHALLDLHACANSSVNGRLPLSTYIIPNSETCCIAPVHGLADVLVRSGHV